MAVLAIAKSNFCCIITYVTYV